MEDIYTALYNATPYCLPKQTHVGLHIYSFSISTLEYRVPLADLAHSGYYHAQYQHIVDSVGLSVSFNQDKLVVIYLTKIGPI